MKANDIREIVGEFESKSNPDDRNASFDYCYNYFRKENNLTGDIEKSCLVLGFYLASWGMLRGSSFLLNRSLKYFESSIQYISTLERSVWNIDVDSYNDENIQQIQEIYNGLKLSLIRNENADLILITKIMLGVFGFVPAFDSCFCKTFRGIANGECGFNRLNVKSLGIIKRFYESNRAVIDNLAKKIFTTDFVTGQKTDINYPKAKIIDMYGFTKGLI